MGFWEIHRWGSGWRGAGVTALAALYVVLTVSALTCALGDGPSGGGLAACAHHSNTAQTGAHGPHGHSTGDTPPAGGTHLSLCKCLDKFPAAAQPLSPDGTPPAYLTRVGPPRPDAPTFASRFHDDAAPRGPPSLA